MPAVQSRDLVFHCRQDTVFFEGTETVTLAILAMSWNDLAARRKSNSWKWPGPRLAYHLPLDGFSLCLLKKVTGFKF